MKTNLAFALETIETTDDTGARTLDPVQLDQLLRLGSAQAGVRSRSHGARARRKLVPLKDTGSSAFAPFRIR